MRPVRVEVITYTPTFFAHCQHCELTFQQVGVGERIHREQARESLPEELRLGFDSLSLWAHGLLDRFGDRLRLKVIDAASIEGFWKSLKYGTWRYPVVIVEGSEKHAGTDLQSVWPAIERRVLAATEASP